MVLKVIPLMCGNARQQMESAQRTTIFLFILPLIVTILGLIKGCVSIVLCFCPMLVCLVFVFLTYINYETIKKDAAKMHAKKYLIASGQTNYYEMQDDGCVITGVIGERAKADIEFVIDKMFVYGRDWAHHYNFSCLVVDNSAYVFAKMPNGKFMVAEKADIYSRDPAPSPTNRKVWY